jgi:hypothetical protein
MCSALALASLAAGLAGCAVEKVYLQDISADSPVVLPPVRVAVDPVAGTFTFSPRITYNNREGITGRVNGHSPVSARGVYEVDSTVSASGTTYREKPGVNTSAFRGKNLAWKTPKVQAGLDMEYVVTDKFALTGFLEFSRNTETDFVAMGAGVALLFGQGTIGGRLEGGIILRDVASSLQYVVASTGDFSSVTDVYFRPEIRRDRNLDFYGSLTLNSRSLTSPVNGLLSLGLSGVTLVSFDAHSPTGGSADQVAARATVLSVSPGLFVDPWKGTRVLACVRVVLPLGIDDTEPSSFIMPMAKVEFSF